MSKRLSVACVVLAVGLAVPGVASAAVFTVNTTADTTVAGGCTTEPTCSLRDAVTAANASTDPEKRIEVPAGTYVLTAGELTISGAGRTVVHGAGARLTTISGNGTSRVLQLTSNEAAVEGVTVTGGFSTPAAMVLPGDGGGVLVTSSGPTTFNQVAVTGNAATLNGGGISAPPESGVGTAVTITASTIAGNRVTGGATEGMGGGVYSFGNLTVTNSTIAGNALENLGLNQGGGIFSSIEAAATSGTKLSLLNSTIAGNTVATGGLGAGIGVVNPTPGVLNEFAFKNTIVAGNTAGGTEADCSGTVAVTSANDLSGDASCLFNDAASLQNAKPLLGPLQNNGGSTDTMALQQGSPAIDAGANAGCPPTDQRGVPRPQGSACDIGAFELQPTPPAPPASADLSLRLKPRPKRPRPGRRLRFLLTVANAGPDSAAGVTVTGTVPPSAKRILAPKSLGKRACSSAKAKRHKGSPGRARAKGSKRAFTCRLGTVATGSKVRLTVVVKHARGRKLRASAAVASSTADPNPGNNRAQATARTRHRKAR